MQNVIWEHLFNNKKRVNLGTLNLKVGRYQKKNTNLEKGTFTFILVNFAYFCKSADHQLKCGKILSLLNLLAMCLETKFFFLMLTPRRIYIGGGP